MQLLQHRVSSWQSPKLLSLHHQAEQTKSALWHFHTGCQFQVHFCYVMFPCFLCIFNIKRLLWSLIELQILVTKTLICINLIEYKCYILIKRQCSIIYNRRRISNYFHNHNHFSNFFKKNSQTFAGSNFINVKILHFFCHLQGFISNWATAQGPKKAPALLHIIWV